MANDILRNRVGTIESDWLEVGLGRNLAKVFADHGQRGVGIDIAENGDDHVIGDKALRVIRPKIVGGERFDRFRLAALQQVIGRRGRQIVVEQFENLLLRIVRPAKNRPERQLLDLLEAFRRGTSAW